MPEDAITLALAEIARVANAVAQHFNAGFDIDRPYDFDESELPLVIMRTGEKEVIAYDDMPAEAWDEFWQLSPSIEIFLTDPVPAVAAGLRTAASQKLREELRASTLLDLIQEETKPSYSEAVIEVDDKPGTTGIFAQIGLAVDNG